MHMNISSTFLYEFQLVNNSEFIPATQSLQDEDEEAIVTKRLTVCPKCYLPLQEPITLSCGFTLCYACYHSSNHAKEVPNRQQCLSFSCLRYHDNESQPCKRNIMLTDILSIFNSHDKHDNATRPLIESIWNVLDCAICLTKLSQPVTLSACGHSFCRDCLLVCRPHNCPLCRQRIICNFSNSKIDQLLYHWVTYVSRYKTRAPSAAMTMVTMDTDTTTSTPVVPFFQISTIPLYPISLPRPQTRCLFQIRPNHQNMNNQRRILTNMLNQPFKKHYALCAFEHSPATTEMRYNSKCIKEGLLLEVEHMEYSAEVQHAVIQAKVLCHVRIHNLASMSKIHTTNGMLPSEPNQTKILKQVYTGEVRIVKEGIWTGDKGKTRNRTREMPSQHVPSKPSSPYINVASSPILSKRYAFPYDDLHRTLLHSAHRPYSIFAAAATTTRASVSPRLFK